MKQRKPVIDIWVFGFSLICFTEYLFLLRYGLDPNPAFVWIAIVGMMASIVWQFYQGPARPKVILAQIFLLSLAAHLISIIPHENGVTNQDFAPYFWTTRLVMENGFWGLENTIKELPYKELSFAWAMPTLAKYPVLYAIGIAAHKATTLSLDTICHWAPSFWSSAGVIAIYLIAKTVYNKERTALFASLGFSTYITFITFHSQYVRESIAFTLMLFSIWAFLKAYKENRRVMAVIATVLCAMTVLAHWNVSVMLIGILAVIVVSSRISSYLIKGGTMFPWAPVLLATVMLLAHWLFVDMNATVQATGEVKAIVEQGTSEGLTFIPPESRSTVKSIQVSYASWAFGILLALGMLWAIITNLRQKADQLNIHIAAATWAAIVFIVFAIGTGNENLHPGRTVIFLYPMVMISVAGLTKAGKVAPMAACLIIAFTLSGFWRAF